MLENCFDKEIEIFIDSAIREDVGGGDYSSIACVPRGLKSQAKLLIKSNCVLSGVDMANKIFNRVDSDLDMEVFMSDGQLAKKGDIAFIIRGNPQSILKSERIVLNCMQRMSAISSNTREYVNLVKDFDVSILDTRKTTPNARVIEKWAVEIGGGENHRFGLYDMIMLKDNHIDFAGGIKKAVSKVTDYLKSNNLKLKVEIEARNVDEVIEIMSVKEGVDRIMLDNFSCSDTKEAVNIINGELEVESSGGIDKGNVLEYARCGVDYISIGELTHSINSIDMSLKAIQG
ncbi:carboxylating nicotinate-nucleotide diphosphorylase [Ichthyobacterium seriolicida]|uniref:Probable nicotinate-nucleotide pyrophosphorylase [carboxylating] n=1 Tax=Ichthyobacterium seriolicida TaxID=242600 RepID=A0A1J1E3I8_9FLAO|nr:carboxylating nicotinate-nucleotide diphosphorylase [Ichthyobacterium seriolicida]BAV94612.1 nicotinate-nucleotide pyrophosphorylase [Ichthyobacterium seriolicida]